MLLIDVICDDYDDDDKLFMCDNDVRRVACHLSSRGSVKYIAILRDNSSCEVVFLFV